MFPLKISLLDIENPTPRGGFYVLADVSSFKEVKNLKMVRSVSLGHFYNKEEAEALKNLFPKTYKPRLLSGYDWDAINKKTLFEKKFFEVCFCFNFMWTNGVTGIENETAMNRLKKVIKKIESINS